MTASPEYLRVVVCGKMKVARRRLHSAPHEGCHGDKADTEKSNIQSGIIGKNS